MRSGVNNSYMQINLQNLIYDWVNWQFVWNCIAYFQQRQRLQLCGCVRLNEFTSIFSMWVCTCRRGFSSLLFIHDWFNIPIFGYVTLYICNDTWKTKLFSNLTHVKKINVKNIHKNIQNETKRVSYWKIFVEKPTSRTKYKGTWLQLTIATRYIKIIALMKYTDWALLVKLNVKIQ